MDFLKSAKSQDSVASFYDTIFTEANVTDMTDEEQVQLIENEMIKMRKLKNYYEKFCFIRSHKVENLKEPS